MIANTTVGVAVEDVAEEALRRALATDNTPAAPVLNKSELEKPEPEEELELEGITADFLQESVRLHLGNDYYKYVSYEDFLTTISSIINEETNVQTAQPIWFPPGVFFFAKNTLSIKISSYYPECIREVQYLSHKRKSVVPNIIISHELKMSSADKARSVSTKYLVTNKQLSELPRRFYNSPSDPGMSTMPFGNCYSGGDLCFGSNVKIVDFTLPDLRSLHWYYEMLFTTPFNNDLGIGALKTQKFRSNNALWYEYLAELAAKGSPFPYKDLNNF
jgi:hypothetical protein